MADSGPLKLSSRIKAVLNASRSLASASSGTSVPHPHADRNAAVSITRSATRVREMKDEKSAACSWGRREIQARNMEAWRWRSARSISKAS
jgi:hypothetical protein